MVGMFYLCHGSEYAPVLQSAWLLVGLIFMADRIPGVGGNSTGEIITTIMMFMLLACTVPDIYTILIANLRRSLDYTIQSQPHPAVPFATHVSMPQYANLFGLGYDYDNVFDIRKSYYC